MVYLADSGPFHMRLVIFRCISINTDFRRILCLAIGSINLDAFDQVL